MRVEKKTKLAMMMTAMRIMTTYFYDDDIHKKANRKNKMVDTSIASYYLPIPGSNVFTRNPVLYRTSSRILLCDMI